MASTPTGSLSLTTALERNDTLASLLQRVQESRARLALVAPLLPLGLRELVRAGPLDGDHWLLLVPHAAAAAKLRQTLPTLNAALQTGGYGGQTLRIKVLPQ